VIDPPNILRYGSEEFCIPYFNPVKQKICRYFPDFIIEVLESNNKVQKYVIEIKPERDKQFHLFREKGKLKHILMK
jgi:hypothetical protein